MGREELWCEVLWRREGRHGWLASEGWKPDKLSQETADRAQTIHNWRETKELFFSWLRRLDIWYHKNLWNVTLSRQGQASYSKNPLSWVIAYFQKWLWWANPVSGDIYFKPKTSHVASNVYRNVNVCWSEKLDICKKASALVINNANLKVQLNFESQVVSLKNCQNEVLCRLSEVYPVHVQLSLLCKWSDSNIVS